MNFPPCIRCGMCCVISPCTFSEVDDGEDCPFLTINEDDTTTCDNEDAIAAFVEDGMGCLFQRPEASVLYDLQMELYDINELKRILKEKQDD